MWCVLWFGGLQMLELVDCCGNICGHGEIAGVCVVIPLQFNSVEEWCVPVGAHCFITVLQYFRS